MSDETMFVYAAAYERKDDARADLEAFEKLASKGMVGAYDAALVTKKTNGKVSVAKHGTSAKRTGVFGAIAGGVIGLLFPPSILMGAAVGAATGAVSGKLWGGMSRASLKELGETLDAGESGLVIVGESKLADYVEKSLTSALRRVRRELNADLKDLEKALAS